MCQVQGAWVDHSVGLPLSLRALLGSVERLCGEAAAPHRPEGVGSATVPPADA